MRLRRRLRPPRPRVCLACRRCPRARPLGCPPGRLVCRLVVEVRRRWARQCWVPVTVSGPFLDDAPPGAREGWRRLNRSGSFSGTHSYGDFGDVSDVGRRGTFGGLGVGGTSALPVDLGSFSSHSRSVGSGSNSTPSHLHSGSGSGSHGRAASRALSHAGSVEGPLSPSVSAFGHRQDYSSNSNSNSGSASSGRRQENSSGSGASHVTRGGESEPQPRAAHGRAVGGRAGRGLAGDVI
ncbi:hypothetical protein C8J57DRAFT_374884 [Mycena rebaudengoi]|nr:hypothetical protein C8J57DRAFT_374884 [Mycena rebaudengoi]